MKNKYLYQGWAGNTFSHKCKDINENTASNIEYLDISELDEQIRYGLAAVSFLAKAPEIKAVFPVGAIMLEAPSQLQKVTEIAILLQEKLVRLLSDDANILTIEQFLIEQDIDPNTIPRITKEEFYNLEA